MMSGGLMFIQYRGPFRRLSHQMRHIWAAARTEAYLFNALSTMGTSTSIRILLYAPPTIAPHLRLPPQILASATRFVLSYIAKIPLIFKLVCSMW